MSMTLNQLAEKCFITACSKGWYGEQARAAVALTEAPELRIDLCRNFADKLNLGERLMLIVTEVAEAMEEYRNGHDVTEVYAIRTGMLPPWRSADNSLTAQRKIFDKVPYDAAAEADHLKPEGFPIEIADALIRIFDLAGAHGIDLDEAVRIKMAYNATRPVRHGGKLA